MLLLLLVKNNENNQDLCAIYNPQKLVKQIKDKSKVDEEINPPCLAVHENELKLLQLDVVNGSAVTDPFTWNCARRKESHKL